MLARARQSVRHVRAPRAVPVPRRYSHRRSIAEKIEDLGGKVIDTSNQRSLARATLEMRPIFKIKEGYAKKLRRQEYIQGLLASKTLEELGQTAHAMKQMGYPFNQPVYEALIVRASQLGATSGAVTKLWASMRECGFAKPSPAAIEALVHVHFREGRWDMARAYFLEMIAGGIQPSALTILHGYTIELIEERYEQAKGLLVALKASPDWKRLQKLYGVAQQRHLLPSSKTMKTLTKRLEQIGSIDASEAT